MILTLTNLLVVDYETNTIAYFLLNQIAKKLVQNIIIATSMALNFLGHNINSTVALAQSIIIWSAVFQATIRLVIKNIIFTTTNTNIFIINNCTQSDVCF